VPYLKLAGLVLSAWQLARAALAARTALDAGSPDGAFLTAKIATAAFFADHLLPQAGGLADAIAEGAPSVLALDEAQF
jgi:acyl-CoA dehydrogenase